MIATVVTVALRSHSMALTYCVNLEFTTRTLLVARHSYGVPHDLRSPRGPQLLTPLRRKKFFLHTQIHYLLMLTLRTSHLITIFYPLSPSSSFVNRHGATVKLQRHIWYHCNIRTNMYRFLRRYLRITTFGHQLAQLFVHRRQLFLQLAYLFQDSRSHFFQCSSP